MRTSAFNKNKNNNNDYDDNNKWRRIRSRRGFSGGGGSVCFQACFFLLSLVFFVSLAIAKGTKSTTNNKAQQDGTTCLRS